MNESKKNRVIDEMIPEILAAAEKSRQANSKAAVSGDRHVLPLENRNIEIVYYRSGIENAPLIVGMHGGGFLFGGGALDDDLWTNVSACLGADVASVDYRQSPEAMDHECLLDVYDSAYYLYEHAQEFGFDKSRISLFGCSAGGNLAAAAALLSLKRKNLVFANQILIYPFLDGYTDPDEKGEGSFSGIMPHVMNKLHFSPELANDPFLSPLYASVDMLMELPNSIVVYCEHDNLRNEAVKYCEMLKNAKVRTSEMLAAEMPHGFIEMGFKKDLSELEINMLGENGKSLFESGLLKERSLETLEFVKAHMV